MLMHCGPVRHRVTSDHDLVRTLVVHPTGFAVRDDIDGDVPGLLSSIIAPALVADEQRNMQIVDDVASAVVRGRNCLVLTGRTDHVDLLAAALRELGLDPLTLYGALKPAERLAALTRLASIDDTGPPLLVVATDKYIGEGFDCPRLDTVFLTYPLSSETPITQYVGRILHEHPGKTDAEVHDYADTKVAMLARMHGKRLTTYRKLGFTTGPVQPRLPGVRSQKVVSATASASVGNEDRAPQGPRPGPPAAQVRAWARSAGLAVSPRGRLSHEILAAYQHAHQAIEGSRM